MISEFTQLSLNLAGTAVGGAGLKTLLAALSAGISGTNLAFEKTFIYESTVPALIMQMNADRSVIRNQILLRMNNDIDKYPWEAAIHDLIDYYNAGTLQNAINSIKKNAGSTQKKMDEELKDIKEIKMISQIAADSDVKLKGELFDSINKKFENISEDDLKQVGNKLITLSQQLSRFDTCSKLNSVSPFTKENVKNGLKNCINSAGMGSTPPSEDLAAMKSAFLNIKLIDN
jgi:hypothetical protein